MKHLVFWGILLLLFCTYSCNKTIGTPTDSTKMSIEGLYIGKNTCKMWWPPDYMYGFPRGQADSSIVDSARITILSNDSFAIEYFDFHIEKYFYLNDTTTVIRFPHVKCRRVLGFNKTNEYLNSPGTIVSSGIIINDSSLSIYDYSRAKDGSGGSENSYFGIKQ